MPSKLVLIRWGHQPLVRPASASALFEKSATKSIMAFFTFGGAVFIDPALKGGSGSYSLISWVHSA